MSFMACSQTGLPNFGDKTSVTVALAECHKKQLNQASFVSLCFMLFAFSGLCLVFVLSVFNLSSVPYFPAYTDVNGTV